MRRLADAGPRVDPDVRVTVGERLAYTITCSVNVTTQVVTWERSMAEIGVKALKATVSAVIEDVEGGAAYVVTKRGRPAAVLLPIEQAEDLVLANTDEFLRMRRRARAAYARGSSTSLGDLD